jgi:hypothetical protein
VLSVDYFNSAFLRMYHLLTCGPFGMVFQHFQDYFDPKDLASGFIQLHHLCAHVDVSCIFWSMVQVFGASRLLALAKPFGGIHLIIVGWAFY